MWRWRESFRLPGIPASQHARCNGRRRGAMPYAERNNLAISAPLRWTRWRLAPSCAPTQTQRSRLRRISFCENELGICGWMETADQEEPAARRTAWQMALTSRLLGRERLGRAHAEAAKQQQQESSGPEPPDMPSASACPSAMPKGGRWGGRLRLSCKGWGPAKI